jgi:hypothetical protein
MTAAEPVTDSLRTAGSQLAWVARSKDLTPIATTITDAVLVAVPGIPGESLHRVAPDDAGMAYQPRALLALLTFCYASGVYASDDIEDHIYRDADFRRVCADEFPEADLLRRFRRLNREAIIHCLAHVLGAVSQQRGNERQFLVEAEQRLRTAILSDLND